MPTEGIGRIWLTWPVALLALVGAITFVGVAGLGYTERTSFCLSCHEQQASYDSWREGPHYRNDSLVVAQCADCHVPPGVLAELAYKGRAVRELYVHVTDPPGPAAWAYGRDDRVKRARERILDAACRRCHDVDQVLPSNEEGKVAHATSLGRVRCVACHATVGHSVAAKGAN